ncbi:hypothetical protein BKA62DRAFT_692763 [Auriculariales sp. MPI-PUGE-AT-0066]|nr:hypothetical protein BKA62DRAFT_692763 [Auriculariales sp. MPI-PUGE-AT-0066]
MGRALETVLAHVARQTTRRAVLLALCLVSKRVQAGAAEWLYAEVEVSRTLRAFLRTITTNSTLAAHVRALSLTSAGLSVQTTKALASALHCLVNLRRLALPPLEHVLHGDDALGFAIAGLPKIQGLSFQRVGDHTQVLAHKLSGLRWLQLHFGLQSLGDLHVLHGCGHLLLTCCQTLEELNVHGFDLATFLETRPAARWSKVRSLTLLSTTNIDDTLVRAFPNVEKLVLRDLDLPADVLSDPQAWPRLRQLTISVPNLVDGEPPSPGGPGLRPLERFTVWNAPSMESEIVIEQLRYYDLSRLCALQFYSIQEPAPSLLRTILENCSSIRFLGIRFDSMKSGYADIMRAGESSSLEYLSIMLSNYVYRTPDPGTVEPLARHFPNLRIIDFIVMRSAAVQWRVSHTPEVSVTLVPDAETSAIEYWEMTSG